MPANPPYQRCSKLDKLDRITYPAILQKKADGAFVNVIVTEKNCRFFTRAGEEFELPYHKEAFEKIAGDSNIVFHGEVIIGDLDRHTSNGLVNSLLKKEQFIVALEKKYRNAPTAKNYDEIKTRESEYDYTHKNAVIHLWDVVPFDDWISGSFEVPYSERFGFISSLFLPDNIQPIESQIVYTKEAAFAIAQEYIRQGYEGAVLKNMSASWKNHTSPNQIKLKNVEECDLKVVDWVEGKGKYVGMMGALVCESSDGRVTVEVGTGFTDEERKAEYVGEIITVLYEKVTKSKTKATYSLSHPRFDGIRTDKRVADDYETIKAKQKVSL